MEGLEVRPPTEEHMQWMRNIATSFKRSYSEVDEEDLYQSLCLWWYEKWDTIALFATDTEVEANKGYILRCLQNAATSFCKNELKQQKTLRPKADDAYYYSRQKVMDMLPFVESPEMWTTLVAKVSDGLGRGGVDPALGNNALAHYADLTTAWAEISEPERMVLRARYVEQLESDEIAELHGLSAVSVRKRIERAVSHMQKIMGGVRRARTVRDREDVRRVVSNAAAQVMTRQAYAGE